MTLPNPEIEKRDLAREYRRLLRAAEHSKGKEDRKRIRKAWELAVEAHKDMRRASGGVHLSSHCSCADLRRGDGAGHHQHRMCPAHDTVEDTWVTLDDIERMFGKRERAIIDGLTKISGIFDPARAPRRRTFGRCCSR